MAESTQHQRLVRALVAHARSNGVGVECAALPGFPEPPVVAGRKPDMLGWVGDRPVVGEAELGPDLLSVTTQQQLASFVKWRGPTGLRAVLSLAVPSRWEKRARRAAVIAGADPARLVVLSPGVRVPQQHRPIAVPPLLQRGRSRPVLPPGILLRRGRERSRSVMQAELNERARRLAREFVARLPVS
jgi:hypothetical protein